MDGVHGTSGGKESAADARVESDVRIYARTRANRRSLTIRGAERGCLRRAAEVADDFGDRDGTTDIRRGSEPADGHRTRSVRG